LDNRRVIVALDVPDAASANELAARLDPSLCRVKVGKELFVAAGPAVVEALQKRGFEVFLDLKFHDIPNTVAGACRSAARLGVWMMNVHASGGEAMMRAAREALATFPKPPLLIGVTVLTSLSTPELGPIGFRGTAEELVERLAKLVHAAGLDGVVCSAQEAIRLRPSFGKDFKLVTPGIRLPGSDGGGPPRGQDRKDDQSRVVSPVDAVKLGADYLVIGRPITQSADPRATLEAIRQSLEGVIA
jgi:orotidine-5'-phosphate decarboxylase